MRVLFSFLILSSWLYANIATVVDTFGTSTLIRDGKTLTVAPKLQLLEHDVIKTGAEAKVKIFFQDSTAVSLGKNTTFEIDKYLFTGDKKSEIKFKVLKGFFKTVTGKIGKIAPNKFKLQTKNATIGIRGTVFAAKVSDETDVVMCTDGSIVLFTPNGTIGVDAGSLGSIRKSSDVEVKNYTLKEKQALIKNAGWHGTMSLEELKEFIKNNFKEPLRSQLLDAIENIYEKDSDENPPATVKVVNADDLGFVDDITINGRAFDELPRSIEFYPEDLDDEKVVVEGLLESEDKNVDVKDLYIEITTDGGETWKRAEGNDEWKWSFTPEFEKEYAFSLRIVKEENVSADRLATNEGDIDYPDNNEVALGQTISIAGFTLNLDANVNLENGKISGSGSIEVPYLSSISTLSNELPVTFTNLSVTNNIVTLGDIVYNQPFVINTPLADLHVSSITFSATPENNKIYGDVVFKDVLASTFGTISLPDTSKLLPTQLSLNIPFESKILNIWQEKNVLLAISEGSLQLSYALGDQSISANLDIPSAQFKFGELLKYPSGLEAEVGMADFGLSPTITLPQGVSLLDTGIQIPSGLNLSFDLSNVLNPSFTFSSSVDLSAYTNSFASNLQNATISGTVTKTGFSATLQGDGGLDPITLINRGSDSNNVKLIFEGDTPSFSFGYDNSDSPQSFSLSGITPKIYFGDLFTSASGEALNKIVSLGNMLSPSLSIADEMYLLGTKIKLPEGFSASVDLSDIQNPSLSFNVNADFSSYDNFIAKNLTGAKIAGTLSKNGFQATVSANKPSPITIYEPNDVKVVFNGASGPSFSVNVTGTESLPEFSISDINAQLDFGSLLKEATNEAESVIAQIGVVTQDGIEALSLNLPAKVKLLESKLAFEGIVSSLNLSTKQIDFVSSVDLSAYTSNPILNALSGSRFDMSVSPSSVSGSISIEDGLEPINIWPSKKVVLNIEGKPTIGVNLSGGGVSFDFGELNAQIDFGDILKTAQDGAQAVVARLSSTVDSLGSYSITLGQKAYLLGEKLALNTATIGFNPNLKSISISSAIDMSAYDQPMLKALSGASLSASISTSGFEGSITKEGSIEPIVVLARGGEGKDVSVKFTTAPTVSVKIQNSGLDFGFDGGSAQIDFGDLLEKATAQIQSVKDGAYSWTLSGRHELYSGAKAYIENIANATLDLKDFANPKIGFYAKIDLSQYGGLLKNVQRANLEKVIISKSGLSGSLSAHLGSVDIWKEKRVSMNFTSDPTLNLSIGTGGLSVGLSDISANIDFGDLLDATAQIGNMMEEGVSSLVSLGKETADKVKTSASQILANDGYSWSINGDRLRLFSSNVYLSSVSGSLDLSDFENPKITFNALADLSRYSSVFKYVKTAEFEEVSISKEGLKGSLRTNIEDISIWKEKGVKVSFLSAPSFYLDISTNGLKVGAKDIDANLHLGSLLNEATAHLETLQDDIYSWELQAKNQLASTSVYLSNLLGKIDFSDLKSPVINIENANIEGLSDYFRDLNFQNAQISKNGFEAYISAHMDDINLYAEGSKRVDLDFVDDSTPTLHLKLTRTDSFIGLSDLNANIKFTNILNNSSLKLTQSEDEGVYLWSLAGEHNFLNDSNGRIGVSNIGGSIDINNWLSPIVVFHTVADFTNYNFSENFNLGVADVTRAEITKTSINWNVTLQNARANFTILELGEGPNDDVRAELRNISGEASNSGGSISGADGTLFFGKLFEGNKQANLTYSTSESGLKKYSFNLSEDLVYKQDDNNFITLKTPSGEVIETSAGVYKVTLNGNVIARSSILSAVSIDELSISSLEVSSSGFSGDIGATFSGLNSSILDGRASIDLRGVGFHIDSTASTPISLNSLDGDLNIGNFFDEDEVKATLGFITESATIGWSLPSNLILHVNTNFEFQNLSGSLSLASLDALSIGFGGKFKLKDFGESIDITGFSISSSGIAGSIDWTPSADVSIFSNLLLKHIGLTLAGVDTTGSINLNYKNSSFLGTGKALDLGLFASVDSDGIDEFSVDGDLASIDVSNFAKFNFTGISIGESLSDFSFNLDGNVKPQNALFNSATELEFSNLKISSSGISLGSVEASVGLSGANASLAGMNLSVSELGLGYDEAKSLFYINAVGGISLDIIGGATADVTLYSDKTISVKDIGVEIHTSGFSGSGSIAWFDGDTVYGDGFKATIGLTFPELFSANGLFRIGQIGDTFYWMANANGGIGGGVPMGPLTLYEVGGGVAYHMIYDQEKKDFIPQGDTLSLMFNTTIGTSGDGGYLWNGQISIIAAITDGGLGQFNLNGDSWILATRAEKPATRKVSARMTYAPSMFHLDVSANITYKGITANGSIDAIMSPSENHVFIGTDREYSYAFNVDRDLGHVSVSIYGIEGTGFFMVDKRAIAFGQALRVHETWSKDWWGPNPSLTFSLEAGAKALFIYDPFQMLMDIYAEVALRGCYGGCISVGADVNLKVAVGNLHNYIWGKAGVTLFGKRITFSGYIRGSGALQDQPDEPDLEIYDRVAIPYFDGQASRIPLMKIYSKFSKAQDIINIQVQNVQLQEVESSRAVSIREYLLEEDIQGTSFMPTAILKKDTAYRVSGRMVATYTKDGDTEEQLKDFVKVFRTTNEDSVAFTDIVKTITPANNELDVHEDKGVEVKYNNRALEILGGVSSSYVRDYKIELTDADGNNILGTFTNPDSNLVAKFKPLKDMRIYRYCVNEEGKIRETFTLDGVYLNPFNDFGEDNGVQTPLTSQINVDSLNPASVNSSVGLNRPSGVNNIGSDSMAALLLAAQEANTQGSTFNPSIVGSMSMQRVESVLAAAPRDLRLGDIRFNNQETALGELVHTTYHDGKSYSYYRASRYNIKVKHTPTNAYVYTSGFNVRYNNIPAESRRKVEQMQGNLEPKFIVSLDENRIGDAGIYIAPPANINKGPNNGFYNEVRTKIEDGLMDIGVYAGVSTHVIARWELEKSDGSTEVLEQPVVDNGDRIAREFLPGIVRGYSAVIRYISEADGSVILEMPMILVTGDAFSAAAEAEEDEQRRQELEGAAQEIRDSSNFRVETPGGVVAPGSGFDGGFSHVGGGSNPMEFGSLGAAGVQVVGGGSRDYGAGAAVPGAGTQIIIDVGR